MDQDRLVRYKGLRTAQRTQVGILCPHSSALASTCSPCRDNGRRGCGGGQLGWHRHGHIRWDLEEGEVGLQTKLGHDRRPRVIRTRVLLHIPTGEQRTPAAAPMRSRPGTELPGCVGRRGWRRRMANQPTCFVAPLGCSVTQGCNRVTIWAQRGFCFATQDVWESFSDLEGSCGRPGTWIM
jgi:hypothetical protein